LKIAIIADPFIPVPPINYGGIERIIDMLINEYLHLGHEVVLIAHPDSETAAELLKFENQNTPFKHLKNIFKVATLKKFNPDIIHNFGRLAYLLPFLNKRVPKLMSYQREPTISQIKKAMWLAKRGDLAFTGCSAYISNQIKPYAPAYHIFNGVDLKVYDYKAQVHADAPLVFLGRIEPIKGTHIAIEIAEKTNKNLIIAGNIPKEYKNYFDDKIAPKLNQRIKYVGAVNDLQKNDLLGKALAFLMPIQWNEPFGIVMAEAMACGTPVIAFNRGSVPEVVIDGINGYRCDTVDQMIDCVAKINKIERSKVREDAQKRFSSTVIAKQYLELYSNLIKNKN
jgi:glycosyltransferase involved in cell wall biosynthesis